MEQFWNSYSYLLRIAWAWTWNSLVQMVVVAAGDAAAADGDRTWPLRKPLMPSFGSLPRHQAWECQSGLLRNQCLQCHRAAPWHLAWTSFRWRGLRRRACTGIVHPTAGMWGNQPGQSPVAAGALPSAHVRCRNRCPLTACSCWSMLGSSAVTCSRSNQCPCGKNSLFALQLTVNRKWVLSVRTV